MRFRWREFVFLSLFSLSVTGLAAPSARPGWEGDVVYHIFVRSYRDSNGDGKGDFKGIIQGLPAIQKLGCTAIMLNPVAKSRVYHNYFADDMMATDPAYGSIADFRAMIRAAHRRHIKVILDMEPQYVADRQMWFEAYSKNPNSRLAKCLWLSGSPAWGSGKNWYDGQVVRVATVNLANPDVLAYTTKVFRFWANQGLDGFRIDHMMDDLDNKHVMTGLLRNFWTPIEAAVRRDHPHMFFIGEQSDWGSDAQVRDIFRQTQTDALFAFPLKQAILNLDKGKLVAALETMRRVTPSGRTEFTFLENHDTERFASAEPDLRKQKLAAALLFLLKGTPSIYYGQELGMKGVQGHWGNDGNDIPVRLGYRWGATLGDPHTPHWYAGTGPWAEPKFSKDHDGISYAEEDRMSGSLLNYYRRLIRFRLAHPALRRGTQEVFEDADPHLLTFRRISGKEKLLVFVNLGGQELIVPRGSIQPTKDLLTGQSYRESIHLPAYTCAVIRAVR
ncbi:MAG TPA: alpha-amylase family glycosyl hydrolase [Fimbriimonadaceae bacterium]|nr:alpha-amylase family glycosyl hydrolase [Fimbriimonadaceae bacterium]